MRLPTLISAAVFVFAGGMQAQDLRHLPVRTTPAGIEYRSDQLLVRFRVGTQSDSLSAARAMVGTRTFEQYSLVPGLECLHITSDLESALKSLNALPFVQYAEPDYIVHAISVPNDTFFNLQWGLNNTGQTINGVTGVPDADIDAPEGWDVSTGDPNFVVAMIDTGTQWSHPDLSANIWTNPGEIPGNGIDDDGNGFVDDVRGWDFLDNDNNPDDGDGHGTHTAGTVGAQGNNGIGVAGVNWACKLMPLRFIGPFGGTTSAAISCLQYAVANGAKVSNNSWGGGGFSQGLFDAISNAGQKGHIFVAAAGNNGSNNDSSPFYPASYALDNIIAVAATTNTDGKASFSNYGATTVDLGAPGVDIASTYSGSQYVYLSGTSMASPHVAGVVAMVYARNPGFTYQQVRNQVLSTVRPIPALAGITVTGGVVNLAAALGGGGSGNTPPTVSITAPADGTTVPLGTPVTFTGSATDQQDGDLTSQLAWTSNLQGPIGSGGSFTRSDLVAGTHSITASVVDSGGLSGGHSITLIVQAPAPPAIPGTPIVTDLGGGSVRIQWADNSNNEDGFDIQREHRVGNNWKETTIVASVGANVTSYVDHPGSGRWRYRVRAFNAAGSSAWTAWVQIRVR
jgi:subtilisin family serine protease